MNPLRVLYRAKDLGGGYAWSIGDQALSSLSNFTLSLLVARSVSPRHFGFFGLVFSAYLLCLGIVRALVGGPSLVRSRTEDGSGDAPIAWASAFAIGAGAIAGAIAIAIGSIGGGPPGTALILLGCGLPGLVLQDAWRFVFFGGFEATKATLNDLVWVVLMAALLVPMMIWSDPTLPIFVGVWSFSGTVAALMGISQSGVRPRFRGSLAWLWRNRAVAREYLADMVLLIFSNHLILYGLAFVAGVSAVGAFRGAQVLLNLMNVFSIGVALGAIPHFTQVAASDPSEVPRRCLWIGGILAAMAAAWGTLVTFLPQRIGEELLGRTWNLAEPLILPMTILVTMAMFMIAAQVGLRALIIPRRSFKARLISGPFLAAGGLTGALLGDAQGATWGLAGGQAIASVVWWSQLMRGSSESRPVRGRDSSRALGDSEAGQTAAAVLGE